MQATGSTARSDGHRAGSSRTAPSASLAAVDRGRSARRLCATVRDRCRSGAHAVRRRHRARRRARRRALMLETLANHLEVVWGAAVALVIVILLTPAVGGMARVLGVVDRPEARRLNRSPVP